MTELLNRICTLALKYDKPEPEMLKQKEVFLGLRRPDGSGVVVGITSKGQVKGYERVSIGNGLNQTKIQPVDGQLFYCGYNLFDFIEGIEASGRFGFEEVAYLLLTSELPSAKDLNSFTSLLSERAPLPKLLKSIIMNQSQNDDQMGALHRAVAAMSLFDPNPNSVNLSDVVRQCIDLIAKFPAIVAYNYNAMAMEKENVFGTGLIEPRPEASIAENFLLMMNGQLPDPEIARILDICLILHAEHGGGNNSTFTVRTVSSSGANTYMAISSGIASLSGHLHGGANEAVIRMIDDIKANIQDWEDEQEIEHYLQKIIKKEAGDRTGKIYGIGHAVYTLSDPRSIILEKIAAKLAAKIGNEKEFGFLQRVGNLASSLVLRAKGKVVSPNVDFYSGFVYQALGIPMEVFTPLFALARITGWCAHRIEEIIQGRIIRPAFVSSLKEEKSYVPLSQRL